MATVFQREARTVQRFVGLPGVTKARLWPMVAAILDRERADHMEIGDQVVLGALNSVFIAAIIAGRYGDVYNALGQILGLHDPAGKSAGPDDVDFPGGAPLPTREVRRPLAKAGR